MGQIVVNYGYRHYLTTAAWRRKRLERLELDGHRCTRCKGDERLEVHHLDYSRVGQEHMDDLVTLCNACHSREHGRDPTLAPVMPDAFFVDRFFEREAMLNEQDRIAEACGVDTSAWVSGERP